MPRTSKEPIHERHCHACGEIFMTHKPGAKRCQRCIDENIRAPKPVDCYDCGATVPKIIFHQSGCPECGCKTCASKAAQTRKPKHILEEDLEEQLEGELRERTRRKRLANLKLWEHCIISGDSGLAPAINFDELSTQEERRAALGLA